MKRLVADLRSEKQKNQRAVWSWTTCKAVQNSGKIDLIRLEGTCRVSTMIIDWKKAKKTTRRIDTITVNSSEMTYQIGKFTTIPSRREVQTINTSFLLMITTARDILQDTD
jgi:hypothetical protein